MKTLEKNARQLNRKNSSRKQYRKNIAGQPAESGYVPDRYFHLQVSRSREMERALNKISSTHDSQKQAVEEAILTLAKR